MFDVDANVQHQPKLRISSIFREIQQISSLSRGLVASIPGVTQVAH